MCGHFRGQLFPHHKSVPFLDLSLLSSEGNDRLFLVALSPLGFVLSFPTSFPPSHSFPRNNTEKMEATHLWIAGGDGLSPTLTSDANVNCLGLTRVCPIFPITCPILSPLSPISHSPSPILHLPPLSLLPLPPLYLTSSSSFFSPP